MSWHSLRSLNALSFFVRQEWKEMWNVRKKIENLKWRSTKQAHTLEKTKQNEKKVRNIDARNVFYVMQLCVSSKRDWFLEFSAPLLRYHLWSCVDCLLTPAAGPVAVSKFLLKVYAFDETEWNAEWNRTKQVAKCSMNAHNIK